MALGCGTPGPGPRHLLEEAQSPPKVCTEQSKRLLLLHKGCLMLFFLGINTRFSTLFSHGSSEQSETFLSGLLPCLVTWTLNYPPAGGEEEQELLEGGSHAAGV